MGLIKAGLGATGGVLADQWKEFFYCDSLSADILVAKGEKRTGGRSSNKRGEDNIISNGSVIAVADGQCMIIVEQGKIVEVCAEPGEFVYDTSSEPSIFCGSLSEGIKNTFVQIGKRFTFGGNPGKDQRVYYFNTKEIPGNKFGTATPIPFKVVVNEQLGYRLSVDLRCNGEYSYKITNPLLFYTSVSGNVADVYERSEIDSMLKSELLNALQPALAKIAASSIQYYEIPMHTMELSGALNEVLSGNWREKRGLEVFSMNINSISIPDDQRKKITEWEENSMTMNPSTAAARLVGAQAQAMQDAAKNEGGMGAMGGFFGMNMAQNAGGANICRGLDYFNKTDMADVIIAGRGGGSIEDLWAFNEEAVARAIYASHIPVISAVGHETDFTIADFVADLRAPTPSAAAELAVPSQLELMSRILADRNRISNAMVKRLETERKNLKNIKLKSPKEDIDDERLKIDNLVKQAEKNFRIKLMSGREQMGNMAAKLDALSPLKVIKRGYAIPMDGEGNVIKSVKNMKPDTEFDLKMSDGTAHCRVE